jgi:hypothetical protein
MLTFLLAALQALGAFNEFVLASPTLSPRERSELTAMIARDEGEHFHFLNTLYTAKIDSEQPTASSLPWSSSAPRTLGRPSTATN